MAILRIPKQLGIKIRGAVQTFLVLSSAVGFCLVFAPRAQADFVGDYAFNNTLSASNMYGNWTLYNTDQVCTVSGCVPGAPSGTNGSAMTPDNGLSVILSGSGVGSGSGGGLSGETDLTVQATMSGTVQFEWYYSSSDFSQYASTIPDAGCGLNNAGPCDDAGYILNGTDYSLADDQNFNEYQSLLFGGTAVLYSYSFAVNAGDTFGFYVHTDDNTGGPGIFTISDFSAPDPSSVPEPSSRIVVIALIAGTVISRRWMARRIQRQGVDA